MCGEPLISVIIPAYNAEATLPETLRSVLEQSYQALEILVVDDGSSDGTSDVAGRFAKQDGRVRIIRQANAGVAAARNHGLAEARAAFVAPVDADDLWRRDKLVRQMQVMQQGGEGMAVVYTWFALIDAQSRIVGLEPRGLPQDLLSAFARRNFIGNGSSALMRREAVIAVGGYDPSLRARGAQGCEDHKLYLSLATRYRFGVVGDYLTGYRLLTGSMSSDGRQMLRSRDLALAEFENNYPQYLTEIRRGRAHLGGQLVRRALRARRWTAAARLLANALRSDVFEATATLMHRRVSPGGAMLNERFLDKCPSLAAI